MNNDTNGARSLGTHGADRPRRLNCCLQPYAALAGGFRRGCGRNDDGFRRSVTEIERFGGLIVTAEDWHSLGSREVARRAIAHALRGCHSLYLSIDVDALDAGFLPGTGSIVHSEITPRQYLDLLTGLSSAPICGVDFVEISPPLDPSGRTEEIAARLLLEALRPHLLVPM